MKVSALLTAIDTMDQAETDAEAQEILERALAACGFEFYALLRTPRPHEHPFNVVIIGNFPSGWAELYVKRKYVLIDPVIRYLGRAQSGFHWAEAAAAFSHDAHARRMSRMMAEAQKYGLEDGYLFPVHGRRGLLAQLSVGGRPNELSASEIALFDGLATRLYWRLFDIRAGKTGTAPDTGFDVKLTHREMEALHYLSDGMTSPEIASILEISNHTVDWYMNGIQQKLKAKNRHHAVAIAFRLGLIS